MAEVTLKQEQRNNFSFDPKKVVVAFAEPSQLELRLSSGYGGYFAHFSIEPSQGGKRLKSWYSQEEAEREYAHIVAQVAAGKYTLQVTNKGLELKVEGILTE